MIAMRLTIMQVVTYFDSCARIDNNRREYWQGKVVKDGVRVCVLRFFLLCCTTVQDVVELCHQT